MMMPAALPRDCKPDDEVNLMPITCRAIMAAEGIL